MGKQFEDILNDNAFDSLDEEKKKLLIALAREIKGKTAEEAFKILIRNKEKLASGRGLTAEEKRVMIKIIKSSLEEPEKSKFEKAVSMLERMGKL